MRSIIYTSIFFLSILSVQAQPGNPVQANIAFGKAPLEVSFKSYLKPAQKYHWEFGNGTTSTSQSPSVVYDKPGKYTVKVILEYNQFEKDTLVLEDYILVKETIDDISTQSLTSTNTQEKSSLNSMLRQENTNRRTKEDYYQKPKTSY